MFGDLEKRDQDDEDDSNGRIQKTVKFLATSQIAHSGTQFESEEKLNRAQTNAANTDLMLSDMSMSSSAKKKRGPINYLRSKFSFKSKRLSKSATSKKK